jgi:hypothetical protein
MERDLVRIGHVTANFFFWQGLRFVPVGVVIVLFGIGNLPWQVLPGGRKDAALVVALGAAVAASHLVGRYYARTFGRVEAARGAHSRRDLLKWVVFYPSMFASLVVDLTIAPPWYLTGPVWGAGVVAYWWSTGRGRYHYLVAAGCMAALAFVQARGLVEPGRPMLAPFAIVLGLTYIVGGVLDHVELCRVLGPVVDTRDEAAV